MTTRRGLFRLFPAAVAAAVVAPAAIVKALDHGVIGGTGRIGALWPHQRAALAGMHKRAALAMNYGMGRERIMAMYYSDPHIAQLHDGWTPGGRFQAESRINRIDNADFEGYLTGRKKYGRANFKHPALGAPYGKSKPIKGDPYMHVARAFTARGWE